jgi:hypothetical protein
MRVTRSEGGTDAPRLQRVLRLLRGVIALTAGALLIPHGAAILTAN